VASRKSHNDKAEPDVNQAARRASLAIRNLQARLSRPESSESVEDLDRQLQEYFAKVTRENPKMLEHIRERVIEGVVERILRDWDQPGGGIEGEIVERLIGRLMTRLLA
jgi:hypothetical protein